MLLPVCMVGAMILLCSILVLAAPTSAWRMARVASMSRMTAAFRSIRSLSAYPVLDNALMSQTPHIEPFCEET